MDKKTIYLIAASQAKSAGLMLQALDSNKSGRDDIAGQLLDLGSDAVMGYVLSEDKKLVKAVKAIRDACDAFLGQQASQ